MKWEELTTPEAVMAAFEAGRKIEYAIRHGGWISQSHINRQTGLSLAKESFSSGSRYRALIEDAPPIPEGFTPWAGGECPEDARGKETRVWLRCNAPGSIYGKQTALGEDWNWAIDFVRGDIIAYRVEQPERQGEAVDAREWALVPREPTKAMLSAASEAQDQGDWIGAYFFKRAWPAMLAAAPQPIPVESFGRDADDGVEALAWMHRDDPDLVICARAKESGRRCGGATASATEPYSIPLGRLRPQVDETMVMRSLPEVPDPSAELVNIGLPGEGYEKWVRAEGDYTEGEMRAYGESCARAALTAALNPEADNG